MANVYGGTLTEEALSDPNNTHAILLRLIGKEKDVLEIGPATGYMTRVLAGRERCRVTGFELSRVMAEEARPYLHKLIVGDLENQADVAKIDGQFDVALLADVLEHLVEPLQPLRELREHLRPEGRLIASVPNVAHWSVRHALLAGRWDLTDRGIMDRTHLRWYTRRTAVALIRSAGYRVVWRGASYVFPWHWRLGGPRVAAWAQRRSMPAAFDDLFAIQHIFVADRGELKPRPVRPPVQKGNSRL
ncbi:MAG: class I SAM-dependent methyltransferase [Rudaea sp.]